MKILAKKSKSKKYWKNQLSKIVRLKKKNKKRKVIDLKNLSEEST